MARALARERSHAAGIPLETSFCRPHQFCKLLPSAQLATIIGPGTIFSQNTQDVRIRLQYWRMPSEKWTRCSTLSFDFYTACVASFPGGVFSAHSVGGHGVPREWP